MKAVVLLSGGVDSATCLAMAVNSYGNDEVTALSIHYGQKHEKEIECARKLAEYYKVKHIEHDVSSVMDFSSCPLLKDRGEIEHKSYAEQLKAKGGEGTVDTYVPFRNGLFLSVATAIALSLYASEVWYGAHLDDAAGRAYPDCTSEFVDSMRLAILEGTAYQVTLRAPLIFFNKAGVVEAGLRLDVPYQYTWSCYEGGDKPCGECGTCLDRQKAFELNGVKDPAMR